MNKPKNPLLSTLAVYAICFFFRFEYSCAVKPHIRAGGNRQSGIPETAIASLLA